MKKHMNGDQALQRLMEYDFKTVLDLGSGKGHHAQMLRNHGFETTSISLRDPADCIGHYMQFKTKPFDAIWCCHVLEHQLEVYSFLLKILNDLKDGGILAITVPPVKDTIVGGHVSLWSAGILIYNLILAGFDCSAARVSQYGNNISAIVRKKCARLPVLKMAAGDIEKLSNLFPIPAYQGMNANFNCNW